MAEEVRLVIYDLEVLAGERAGRDNETGFSPSGDGRGWVGQIRRSKRLFGGTLGSATTGGRFAFGLSAFVWVSVGRLVGGRLKGVQLRFLNQGQWVYSYTRTPNLQGSIFAGQPRTR